MLSNTNNNQNQTSSTGGGMWSNVKEFASRDELEKAQPPSNTRAFFSEYKMPIIATLVGGGLLFLVHKFSK